MEERVSIIHADATTVSLEDATAVFLYLVPEGLKRLAPVLRKRLDSGCRIASYTFSLPPTFEASSTRKTKAGLTVRLYENRSLRDHVVSTAVDGAAVVGE